MYLISLSEILLLTSLVGDGGVMGESVGVPLCPQMFTAQILKSLNLDVDTFGGD